MMSESGDVGRDWVDAMRAGDFARAWDFSDRHLRNYRGPAKHIGPRHQQVIWRGEELAGKRVLVRCYHGLGDTIQFLRFILALRRVAREVILFCQAPLLPIARRAAGVDLALPLHDDEAAVDFDVDIEIMEIPHAIRVGRDVIAMEQPYLHASEGKASIPGEEAGGLSVGLVWEVGDWDKRRSIPSHLLGQLNASGVRLYSLQLNAAPGSVAGMGADDISTPDIETLAGILKQINLVICVDTMVAHLAGALGTEAWILLHADCDWRWPATGSRSIWYPRARLFHQTEPGDWAGVVDQVRAALGRRTADAAMRSSPDGEASALLRL
jgi:hypothetical protein